MAKTKRRELNASERLAQQNLRRIWDAKKGELGLTQESAAEKMGFSTQGAVGHYLNGHIPLNTDAVIKFSRLLKVKPTEIDKEFAVFEDLIQQPTKTAGKSDRQALHDEIDRLPDRLLDKFWHLLEYVKDTEDRTIQAQSKAARKK